VGIGGLLVPKRKKKATDQTTAELARRLFPKKVVEEIERVAHKGEKSDSEQEQTPSSKAE